MLRGRGLMANAKSLDGTALYVIASEAKQSLTIGIEIASSLRSSQQHRCDPPNDFRSPWAGSSAANRIPLLLRSQGHHGIDVRRAAGRKVAGQQRGKPQQGQRRTDTQRIDRADAIERTADHPRRRERQK